MTFYHIQNITQRIVKMKPLELEQLIDKIYLYFAKRPANQQQKDVWYDDLKKIPSEARKYILDALKKNDKLPLNLPKAIRAIHYQWRQDNPNKVAYQKEPCEHCDETGHLLFKLKGADYMARCGHCGNWRRTLGELAAYAMYDYQIEGMGGLIIKTAYDSAFAGAKRRELMPLLEKIGERINE